MSWDAYVTKIMADEYVEDAAICGCENGKEAVWASTPNYASITMDEIKRLCCKERSELFKDGPSISGVKCMVLRDNLNDDKMYSMDLKTAADAEGHSYNVCVGKSHKALVIAKGKKDANGGQVATPVFDMAKYLRDVGY